MKDAKTKEEQFIEKLIEFYGNSNLSVVDKTTGEIIDLPFGSVTKFPSLPKLDKYNRILTKFLAKEKFVKLYKRTIHILSKELSYRNFTWFVEMSEYVGMLDCILYDDDDNYLNIRKLSKLMDIDYNNLCNAFKDFESKELIKKIEVPSKKDIYKKVKAIAVNPYLYMNGEYIVEKIKQEFVNTRWAKMYE